MDFSLSESQILIRDSFTTALTDLTSLDLVRQQAGKEPDKALWDRLCQLGVAGLMIPEPHGGTGLGLLEAALVSQELGRAVTPSAFVGSCVMAPLAISRAANKVQQDEWLEAMAVGEKKLAMALSDLGSGAEQTIVATQNPDQSVSLNGQTSFALDGGLPDAVIVTDGLGERLFLLQSGAPGVRIELTTTIDVTRRFAQVSLTDASAQILPGANKAFIEQIIDAGRVMLAADTLGAAQCMLEQAVDYASRREQFGRSIAGFQAVKHMCAEMAAHLQPCQAMVWHAAYAYDELPDQSALATALTKSHLDEVGRYVARTATEVHGGMGFTELQGLHYWFKRIGANRPLLGGPEWLRERAAHLQGF